jgi:hypothetical protein
MILLAAAKGKNGEKNKGKEGMVVAAERRTESGKESATKTAIMEPGKSVSTAVTTTTTTTNFRRW